ncbi:hypothetical protein ACFOZY_11885 [Chungangia koreensis]|uniref:YceG-like family protein n=1 Tax=Chungangia koreensis TaxID=752657 RepID=A0ABV8X7P8_9LACT
MKKMIRALGIGIFLSGAFVFVYGQNTNGASGTSSSSKPGYELVSKDELKELRAELKTAKEELAAVQLSLNQAQSEKSLEKTSSKKEETPAGNFLLIIEKGANPVTISQNLKKAKILSNERDFINYLEDHDLSSKIQVGQYTITPKMTLSEIAEAITK